MEIEEFFFKFDLHEQDFLWDLVLSASLKSFISYQ